MRLYSVNETGISSVDAARHYLFLQKGKDFIHMPPGSDALNQHLLRVAYQSGHVWGNMLIKAVDPVPVKDWGWQQDSPESAPSPVFTIIPIISKNIPELVICNCKTVCKPPCICKMHAQPCMVVCPCPCS